ncbi:MAG: amidohydrolase [Oscillospiraceae bacterium]|nr:amidohydrolase [Oscillospiraceae bacterium]
MTYKAIDMHCHPLPDKYFKYINETGKIYQDKCPFFDWSEELTFNLMDKVGIEKTVLWISSPNIHAGDDKQACGIARELNEEMTEFAKKHIDKIYYVALLPLPDVKGAAEEVRYTADNLGVAGFTLNTNMNGMYLGDPAMDPILKMFDERGSLVIIHPTRPSAVPEGVLDNLPIPMLEFMFDSTRALVNMMTEGTLNKFPNIRWIVPHCGGALPYLIDRLVQSARNSGLYDGHEKLRKFYFDISGGSLPRQLPLLMSLVGEDRLVYGTDWGFKNVEECIEKKKNIEEFELLTHKQKEKIFYNNAANLLGMQSIEV